MKSAYIIVTDLHIDFSKANRNNYFGEVLDAITQIMSIANEYRKKEYKLQLLLLGDVFDSGLSNPSEAMQGIELFRYFCSNFDSVFSVVGNHEISFAKDNPFWFLVTELMDSSLMGLKRYIQPRGITPVVNVVDTIEDGEVTFYFNHFGTSAKTPEMTGVRIGLFHQNVGSNDICKMWGTFDDVEDAAYIQGYNYCFLGHMHLALGRYYLNKEKTCQCEWLGSIGRTKVDEVDDTHLTRNVPVVLVEDGKFCGIEDNPITLWNREKSVNEKSFELSKRNREVAKSIRQNSDLEFKGKTLYEMIDNSLADKNLYFVFHWLDKPLNDVRISYLETLENAGDEESDNDE